MARRVRHDGQPRGRPSSIRTGRGNARRQRRQRIPAWRLDLQRKQRVSPREPDIDRGNRRASARRPLAKPIARINHQRRADDEHRVRPLQRVRRGGDALARYVFSEEYDVGLEHAAARRTRRHAKKVERIPLEMRVAVGGHGRRHIGEAGILAQQLHLYRAACVAATAIEAINKVGSVFYGPILGMFLLAALGRSIKPIGTQRCKN